MKKTALLILLCLTLFAACDDLFEPPVFESAAFKSPQDAEVPAGYGRVAIKFNSAARTVFPTPAFNRYVFKFTPAGGGVTLTETKQPNESDFNFMLEAGGWHVEVKAYVNADDTDANYAASGAEDFSVSAGPSQTPPVNVKLVGNVDGGNGTFSYYIEYPEDADIKVFQLENILDPSPPIDLIDNGTPVSVGGFPNKLFCTELPVPAGYYDLTILFENDDGAKAGASEVVHIYKNLNSAYGTSDARKVFTSDNFSVIGTAGLAYEPIPDADYPIEYRVSGYTGSSSQVVIPAYYKGLPVTEIGSNAFENNTDIISITIPDSVTSIGANAFTGCTNLTGITVDTNNQQYVSQDGILYNNAKTSFIHIPKKISGSVTIPSSITTIAQGAFQDREDITSITLPFVGGSAGSNDHFGYIFGAASYGNNATSVPEELKTVVITGGSSIGADAFNGCANIENITVSGVSSIGLSAFAGCTKLESITLPFVGNSLNASSNDAIFGYIFGAAIPAQSQTVVPESLKTVIITGGTRINNTAFSNCLYIKSITFPNNITNIGQAAFNNCASLTDFNIPDSVQTITQSAFQNCVSLTSITIPAAATIGNGAFAGCRNLTDIRLAEGNVSYISEGGILYSNDRNTLLAYPSARGNITIPDNVRYINQMAFYYNTDIAIVSFNSGSQLKIIDINAFSYSSLTTINIPSNVEEIGNSAFNRCTSLTSVTIGSSVESIGSSAFRDCIGLTEISIPNSVKSIESYAFAGSGLTSIIIPNTLDSISTFVFQGCSSLESVTISNGFTKIGSYTFQNCIRLESITIPSSVTEIGVGAFTGCTGLTSVTFEGTILSSNFNTSTTTFPGDLRDRFYVSDINNGTPGTYVRDSGGSIWAYVIDIGDAYGWNNLATNSKIVSGEDGDNPNYYIINIIEDNISVSGIASPSTTFTATNINVTINGGDNGKTITLSSQGSLLRIGANQTVTMKNLTFIGHNDNNTSLVYIDSNDASLTMNGGAIKGNNNKTNSSYISEDPANQGGGVCANGGTFVMNGGEISGNTAKYGGGVSVIGNDQGFFKMLGGEIWGNTAITDGGGVLLCDTLSYITNGTIYGSNETTEKKNNAPSGAAWSWVGADFSYGPNPSGEWTSLDGSSCNNTLIVNGGVLISP